MRRTVLRLRSLAAKGRNSSTDAVTIISGPQGSRDYAASLARDSLAVAQRLAGEGVVGRFSVDFLACREGDRWTTYALEANLRNGGTTHPLATLTALCGDGYDVASGTYVTGDGRARCYQATDHLASPAYASLTTDDVLASSRRGARAGTRSH